MGGVLALKLLLGFAFSGLRKEKSPQELKEAVTMAALLSST